MWSKILYRNGYLNCPSNCDISTMSVKECKCKCPDDLDFRIAIIELAQDSDFFWADPKTGNFIKSTSFLQKNGTDLQSILPGYTLHETNNVRII